MNPFTLNDTHDPSLKSWVAEAEHTDFPIQNLPWGIFIVQGRKGAGRVGVAIGDQILDITAAHQAGLFSGVASAAAALLVGHSNLNPLMAAPPGHWSALRLGISQLLRSDSRQQDRTRACLVPMDSCHLLLPVQIGDYTDFFASIDHARNMGSMMRPDNPLLPNYKYIPIAYHGRASSIGSGYTALPHQFRRPIGQVKANDATSPAVLPSARMDYELELGIWIGGSNPQGSRVDIANAGQRLFGVGLLNDWSARDIQAWEYQPLGPFLAKNFASTVSPWVVTTEALLPFRVPARERAEDDPAPLLYLDSDENRKLGGWDIKMEVLLLSEKMRASGQAPLSLARSNFSYAYWTALQMIAHHTIGGCNLNPGDLLGSGTISGPGEGEVGSLIERTRGGKLSIDLPGGEERRFLEDGDTVILRAWCEKDSHQRIGFGECAGTVLPAHFQSTLF